MDRPRSGRGSDRTRLTDKDQLAFQIVLDLTEKRIAHDFSGRLVDRDNLGGADLNRKRRIYIRSSSLSIILLWNYAFEEWHHASEDAPGLM